MLFLSSLNMTLATGNTGRSFFEGLKKKNPYWNNPCVQPKSFVNSKYCSPISGARNQYWNKPCIQPRSVMSPKYCIPKTERNIASMQPKFCIDRCTPGTSGSTMLTFFEKLIKLVLDARIKLNSLLLQKIYISRNNVNDAVETTRNEIINGNNANKVDLATLAQDIINQGTALVDDFGNKVNAAADTEYSEIQKYLTGLQSKSEDDIANAVEADDKTSPYNVVKSYIINFTNSLKTDYNEFSTKEDTMIQDILDYYQNLQTQKIELNIQNIESSFAKLLTTMNTLEGNLINDFKTENTTVTNELKQNLANLIGSMCSPVNKVIC